MQVLQTCDPWRPTNNASEDPWSSARLAGHSRMVARAIHYRQSPPPRLHPHGAWMIGILLFNEDVEQSIPDAHLRDRHQETICIIDSGQFNAGLTDERLPAVAATDLWFFPLEKRSEIPADGIQQIRGHNEHLSFLIRLLQRHDGLQYGQGFIIENHYRHRFMPSLMHGHRASLCM